MVIDRDRLLAARKLLWYGRADVYTYESVKDPVTKQTSNIKKKVFEQLMCHKSKKLKDAPQVTASEKPVDYEISLSLQNDIVIPPGSEIVVTQNGVTETFRYSGKPIVYIAHQEINLVLKEQYA